MSDSLITRVLAAAETLEQLQQDPITSRKAYEPRDLRAIVTLFRGGGER